MKKNVIITGGLKEMVTYCSAIYTLDGEFDKEQLNDVITSSPIFEDKNFYTNVLGTVQKTTVTRYSKLFFLKNTITFQLRYEMLKVVDIDLTQKDQDWINQDIKHLLEHFELLINSEQGE